MNSSTVRKQIESMLSEVDVVETISYIAMYKEIGRIPRSKKSDKFNFVQNYPLISYLVGLGIKQEYKEKILPDETKITILLSLLEKYFEELGRDFSNSVEKNTSDAETHFLKFLVGMHHIVTQDAPENLEFQTAEILQNFLGKFNDYFVNKIGFSVDDAIVFYQKIKSWHGNLLISRINKLMKIDSENKDRPHNDKEFVSILFGNARELYSFNVEEFSQNENIKDLARFKKYLAALSCKFGDGKSEYDSPFEENPFIDRPLIDLGNDRIFCPEPEAVFYNLPMILENVIKDNQNSQNKILAKYVEKKSKFLEEKTNEFLHRIFPPDSIHKNCTYNFQGKPGETDTLIEFDNKILIVEAKAGIVSSASKRGGILSLQSDLNEIVKKAHEQGKKTREYIKSSSGTVIFKDKNNTQFKIKYQPGITQFYLVNVTWEPLFSLATNPRLLKSLKLFEDDEYLWSVNLSDFDIITRKMPKHLPSVFLHYLRQRLSAITDDLFFAGNELAFLMFYFKIGNFITISKHTKPEARIGLPAEFISEITDHYIKGTPSPQLEIESELLEIIKHLEEAKPENYTNIIFLLLDLDKQMRKNLVDQIKKVTKFAIRDGKSHDFKLMSKELDLGLSFMVYPRDDGDMELFTGLCELRKYQAKITRWLGIARTLYEGEPMADLFAYSEYPYRENDQFERLSKQFPPKPES